MIQWNSYLSIETLRHYHHGTNDGLLDKPIVADQKDHHHRRTSEV